MCAGKPSLSALGFGGKIFPPSLLMLWWLSGEVGSASIGAYLVTDSTFNCLALICGCLNSMGWLYWSHRQNSFAVAPTAATIPGSCWDVLANLCSLLHLRKSAVSLLNCRITTYLYLWREKHTSTNRNIPPKVRAFLMTSQGRCASPGSSVWIHHVEPTQFLATVEFFATPRQHR